MANVPSISRLATTCMVVLSVLPCFAVADRLVIGRVSDNPEKHERDLRMIGEHVVAQMGDLGIDMLEVVLAPDNKSLLRALRRGSVDWINESPVSALYFEESGKAEILLKRWKKGADRYGSVMFARKDSGIESVADLSGKKVAFEDAGSTSAFFLPAAAIVNTGLELEYLETPREAPFPGAVSYAFSGGEVNSATWVHKGIVDAAAFSNLDWERDIALPPALKNDLKVFHSTQEVPRSLEMVRTSLDPVVKRRLKEILLNIHLDPSAAEALAEYQDTTKFGELADADKTALDLLRAELDSLLSLE